MIFLKAFFVVPHALFQAVPNLEKLGVKSLTVFQRTACWSPPRLDYLYPEFVKKMFAWLPFTNIAHRYFIFWRNEARYRMIFATDGIIAKVHKYFYCSEFKVAFLHKSSIKFGMLHSNSFSSRYLHCRNNCCFHVILMAGEPF